MDQGKDCGEIGCRQQQQSEASFQSDFSACGTNNHEPSQPPQGQQKTEPLSQTRLRLEMRERLYKLLQDRSAQKDPKMEAAAIEVLLFRSVGGSNERYSMLLRDQDTISAKLKEVGTRLLIRKLQKTDTKLGFRKKMVLTGSILGGRTDPAKGRTDIPRVVVAKNSNAVDHSQREEETGRDFEEGGVMMDGDKTLEDNKIYEEEEEEESSI